MEVGEVERAVLDTIVAAPLAWSPTADLEATGHALETLAGLQFLGLVEPWGSSADLVWTLTPWGATLLEVIIIEHGSDEVPRWGRPADVPRFIRSVRESTRHCALKFPEQLADKAPGPAEEFLLDEASGEPLLLFGRTVVKDKRIKPAQPAKKGKTKGNKKASRRRKSA